LHFFEELEKIGTNKLPGSIGTIKLPERQIMVQVTHSDHLQMELKWRAIRDNLRNFFLSPPAEMLSFLQQLREAVY
jgi:hypothetical protein